MATITYTVNDGTATLTMQWIADKTKLTSLATDAGKYFYYIRWQIYNEGVLVEWDNLTNQQKLNVLLQEATFHLKSGATAFYTDETVTDAKSEMDLERYEI